MMADNATLVIENLHVSIEDKEILRGLDLTVAQGERHVLMGANGSGKSTLAYALMGHPAYTVTAGTATFGGHDVLALEANERAELGLFLAFQSPKSIPGVSLSNFLRQAAKAVHQEELSLRDFSRRLSADMKRLSMPAEFARRYLNDGFSGGEQKRCEMLQLLTLRPKLAILDETDSGLDVAMRQLVANVVLEEHGHTGFLVVTHYEDVVRQMQPDRVHIMAEGRVVMSGGMELVDRLTKEKSWEWVLQEA
jgi:Fe-S cluster assembly ATP-binding protein